MKRLAGLSLILSGILALSGCQSGEEPYDPYGLDTNPTLNSLLPVFNMDVYGAWVMAKADRQQDPSQITADVYFGHGYDYEGDIKDWGGYPEGVCMSLFRYVNSETITNENMAEFSEILLRLEDYPGEKYRVHRYSGESGSDAHLSEFSSEACFSDSFSIPEGMERGYVAWYLCFVNEEGELLSAKNQSWPHVFTYRERFAFWLEDGVCNLYYPLNCMDW